MDWVPEVSRRARGFPVYAALRALGRGGVEDLVERCCAWARMAERTSRREPGIEVLNDVVLNQVLVRCRVTRPRRSSHACSSDGACWLGGTSWEGARCHAHLGLELATTEDDIDRSAESIVRAHRAGYALH